MKMNTKELKAFVAARYAKERIAWLVENGKTQGHRTDTRLLHGFLSSKWYSVITKNYEPSFLEELQARGYDITTLKFEIKKTAPKEQSEAKDL